MATIKVRRLGLSVQTGINGKYAMRIKWAPYALFLALFALFFMVWMLLPIFVMNNPVQFDGKWATQALKWSLLNGGIFSFLLCQSLLLWVAGRSQAKGSEEEVVIVSWKLYDTAYFVLMAIFAVVFFNDAIGYFNRLAASV